MARPNILTYKGDGKLQYIDDTEFNGIAEVVLEKFATVDGPGNIYASNGGGSYTSLGTFTDTRFQGAVGTGDITILSTQSELFQDLTSNYGTVTDSPVHWDAAQGIMKVADNNDLNDLADEIVSYMVDNDGPGTYELSASAPSGGTWQSIATIDNINDTGTTTTYTLYKKIAGTVALTQSPLKVQGSSLKEMSQAEIEQLTEKVRERIVTNGIGQYAFQGSAPVTGTWANKGTITDTRPTTSPANYDGADYIGDYVGDYDGITPFNYTGSYTGVTPANYIGPTPQSFAGQYTGTTPAQYTGLTPINYTATYAGTRSVNYTGVTPFHFLANYTGTYTGTTDTGQYFGFVSVNYSGPGTANYLGTTPANYTGTTPANYLGTTPANYTGTTPANYTGTNPGPGYVATNFEAFSGSFTGPGNPVTYLGPFYDNSIFLPFLQGAYVGPNRTSYRYYIQYYSGGRRESSSGTNPPASYVGPGYVGTRNYATFFGPPVPANFAGTTPANFTGTTPANFAGTTPANFTGTTPANYLGPAVVQYISTVQGLYYGPTPVNFEGGNFVSQYTGTTSAQYTGTAAGNFSTSYTGTTPAQFTGITPINYEGNYVGLIPANFLGVTPAAYGGGYTGTTGSIYLGDYAGNYVASYGGAVINNDSTIISTLTLWRRIA